MTYLKLFVFFACIVACTQGQQGSFSEDALDETARFARQVLDYMIPKILLTEYANARTQEGYRFHFRQSDNSYREEIGMILNPGTKNEELLVMGAFTYNDGKTETLTMYTADKNGYRPRVTMQPLGVTPKLLQSLSG